MTDTPSPPPTGCSARPPTRPLVVDAATDLLDELFHGCAWAAFVEQARIERGWPDRESTRRRAYRLYEDALAEKSRLPSAPAAVPRPRPAPSIAADSND